MPRHALITGVSSSKLNMVNLLNGLFFYLAALDPAGPCFRKVPRVERLNSDAAKRVDVLHTNIDGFGIAEPSGHVDFYANGGNLIGKST